MDNLNFTGAKFGEQIQVVDDAEPMARSGSARCRRT